MVTFNKEIRKLLKEFIARVDLKDYLIYGSCAYTYYTNEYVPISDIDIIVSKNDFPQIINKLQDSENFIVFPFEKTIHVNSKNITGNDGKAFDISIDSYEDYFSSKGIEMTPFEIDKTNNFKFIKIYDLIHIYKFSQEMHPKSSKYKIKVLKLHEVTNKSA